MQVRKSAVLALSLCLFATVASAQITAISPTSFTQFAPEEYITITGTNLTGTEATLVVYDGIYVVEPADASPTQVIAFVVPAAVSTSGVHFVEVLAIDSTETRTYGPVNFTVIEIGGGGGSPPTINIPEIVLAEATSAAGAIVNYTVTAFDDAGSVAVSCSPPSGSAFPFGGTSVTCSATNANGTTNAQFSVVVVDFTPPVVTVPADFTVVGPEVTFTVSAVDDIDGPVAVSCAPPSGSTFLSGITTVFCTAFDSQFNPGFGFFNVTVTGGAPMITVPSEFLTEATGPAGAVVNYPPATATGDATISCTPPSGSMFPLGFTTVTCTATNAFGSASDSFLVNVFDGTPPVITVPGDITVTAGSPAGTVVTYVASAVDLVEGVVAVTCDPASGSTFPIGTTPVVCTASDTFLTSTASFLVNVIEVPPPVLDLPGTITAEATGPSGAVVTYTATAVGGEVVTCAPPSGSTFPLGTTSVNCSATNLGGTTTGSFDVIVEDTTPPEITVPSQITTEATSPAGAVVTYVATATDLVDGDVTVDCAPLSGSTFALGTTNVLCTASDSSSNTASASFQVIVEDTTPPEIVEVTATPNVLWPPNHQMVNVVVEVDAVDISDPSPITQIVSVSSNQPINGTGDGDMAPDWVITGPLTLQLRSERSHGKTRIYTITVEAVDASGNRSTATVEVIVTNKAGGKMK